MSLPQCNAIVLHGRDRKGNRGGLIPPRRCERVARKGTYCGLHTRQRDLQDLIRDCMGLSWEIKVKLWEDKRRRATLRRAEGTVTRLAEIAEERVSDRLAWFLRANRHKLAESLADT